MITAPLVEAILDAMRRYTGPDPRGRVLVLNLRAHTITVPLVGIELFDEVSLRRLDRLRTRIHAAGFQPSLPVETERTWIVAASAPAETEPLERASCCRLVRAIAREVGFNTSSVGGPA